MKFTCDAQNAEIIPYYHRLLALGGPLSFHSPGHILMYLCVVFKVLDHRGK